MTRTRRRRSAVGWAAVPAAAWLLGSDLGVPKIAGAGLVAAWVALVLAPAMAAALDRPGPHATGPRHREPGEHQVPGSHDHSLSGRYPRGCHPCTQVAPSVPGAGLGEPAAGS